MRIRCHFPDLRSTPTLRQFFRISRQLRTLHPQPLPFFLSYGKNRRKRNIEHTDEDFGSRVVHANRFQYSGAVIRNFETLVILATTN